jgi:hypothetical protein
MFIKKKKGEFNCMLDKRAQLYAHIFRKGNTRWLGVKEQRKTPKR